ncbi:MAG: hypothetical protein EOO60_12700 [Hymenobacter sp.]|nr:MAG: hypothetical protein EOO60_12700 [Hymenobacter sp.]
MLNKEEARQIALDIIGHLAKTSGQHYIILEDAIQEHPLAWVFPFNTVQYAASRNFREMALGVAPIVVKRKTGEARMAPPMRLENFLERYLAEEDTETSSNPAV